MKSTLKQVKQELSHTLVTVERAGVLISISCDLKQVQCRITDPGRTSPDQLGQVIGEVMQEALQKAKQAATDAMRAAMGGADIASLMQMFE